MSTFENCQPENNTPVAVCQPKPVRCGCGGEVAVLFGVDKGHEYYIVKCWGCGTQTVKKRHKAEAVQAWNKAMGERTAKVEGHRCTSCDNHIRPCMKYCDHWCKDWSKNDRN